MGNSNLTLHWSYGHFWSGTDKIFEYQLHTRAYIKSNAKKTVMHFQTAMFFSSSLSAHCKSLGLVSTRCDSLWLVATHCDLLRLIVIRCILLWLVVIDIFIKKYFNLWAKICDFVKMWHDYFSLPENMGLIFFRIRLYNRITLYDIN